MAPQPPGIPGDTDALYRQYNVNPSAAGFTLPTDEPMILMGYEAVTVRPGGVRVRGGTIPEGPGEIGQPTRAQRKTEVSFDQAMGDIYSWNATKFDGFANQLVNSGRIPPAYTRDQVVQEWQDLVRRARETTLAGKQQSPWDLLAWMGAGPGGSSPYGPRTTVQKSITISTPEEARAILESSLAQRLGRRPSESELDDFQSALNAAQRARPSVTTTSYAAGGDQASSTTTGGVDAAAFTGQWAERELGGQIDDYQVAALLLPEFMRAIESPV